MSIREKNNPIQDAQNFISFQDLFYMCLAKWQWFVLSIVICFSVAICYLLTTEPEYMRTASILIKDDSKSKSMSDDMNAFADIGLFSTNSNVNNEMGTLKSPDLIREVISRLHLETNYQVPGRFHKQTVYGGALPVNVFFAELADDESVKCELELKDGGIVSLSSFEKDGEHINGTVEGKLNDTIQSPVGNVIVIPTDKLNDTSHSLIYVSHSSIHSAVADYTRNFSVAQTDEKSNIITLSFKDVSTQRAEDILITHIAVYNENWIKDKNQIAVYTSMFINERLGVIEEELGNVDDNISSYKSEQLLPDVQASANMYITQANEAQAVIRDLNTQVYMARYIRSYLTNENNKFQMVPANLGVESHSITAQITEYNQQLLERNSLVSNSSARNPLVIQMDASLESIRSALLTSIDNELVALNARIKSQQAYSGHATSQIASNPKQAKYLLSVERQQKVKESLYLYLLQKREENELNQAFTAYNTRIIAMPNGSMLPTAPISRNILLVAFTLGVLIPIVIIFIKENTNTVVRGRKDLEKLSLPIIGEIPQYVRKQKGLFKKKQTGLKAVVVKPGSRDIINEAFRVLRTNLEFMSDDNRKQNVFVVTSFNQGSGKSFLSVNMAISLAIKEKKVLIIDGDMRHASASAYIGSPTSGLSNYLGGKINDLSDIIVHDGNYEHLSVLPVGTIPPNPTELLFSDRLKQLIETVKEQFDYVFIDCPPVEIVADTQIIEKLADRTIFVVRAGLFDRNMLPELENIYTQKKYKKMSLILNGTESIGGKYGYRYGYKYGYGTHYYSSNSEISNKTTASDSIAGGGVNG